MAGDNSLDTALGGNQLNKDIKKMETTINTTNTNVIVLADRNGDENTYIYNILNDNSYCITSPTISVSNLLPACTTNELNMGDPATLVAFSTWVITNWSADNYCLVLWNHGGGWWPKAPKRGIAWDDNTLDNDYLTTAELGTALSQIKTILGGEWSGKKIDIVGFDACLMAQLEVAYQIKDYADYMVASEENEYGWPYDGLLAELGTNPNYEPEIVSQKIVEIWDKAYSDETFSWFSVNFDSRTASAIDLSKIETLTTAIDNLATELLVSKNTVPLYLTRDVVDFFGGKGGSRDENDKFGGIDIYDLAYIIKQNPDLSAGSLRNAAVSVMDTVNDCVIANKTGNSHKNAHGLSINFPKTLLAWQNENNPDNYYETLQFAQATHWDEFLTDYYSKVLYGPQSLNYVVSAPNPYNPLTGNLTIKNFPDNSQIEVKIYNLEGVLVRKIEGSGNSIDWDGKNEEENTVASGIYFYVAKTQTDSCKGKITVIKR